jgi:hypothetical protein
MRPVRQVLSLPSAVANNIALSQTTAGAASLTLNGSLAQTVPAYVQGNIVNVTSAQIAALNAVPQSQITITSGGNDSAVNFTITGTDYRGTVVSEVLAGPNANTVTSVNSYATITSITTSGAVASAVTVGTAQSGSSPIVVFDQYISPFSVSLTLTFSSGSTANVTVQYTNDPVFGAGSGGAAPNLNVPASLDALTWFNDSSLTAITANNMSSLISPVSAARLVWNSGAGTVTYTSTQAGNGN